jgi:hypothetical protein
MLDIILLACQPPQGGRDLGGMPIISVAKRFLFLTGMDEEFFFPARIIFCS